MIANLFLALGLNRDHVVFLWGKLLSIALLVNSGVFDLSAQAAYLGIHLSPTGAHWIQALAVIALYISGQYSTSSLPGQKAAVWLIVALLGSSVLVSGCAGLRRPVDPATVRGQLAEKTNRVEHAIAPLQDLEIQAERAALVIATDASARDRILQAHVIVQKDIKALSADVRHVAEVAVGLSSDPQPLATLIQQLTVKVQPLVDEIAGQFGVSPTTRTAIGAAGTVLAGAIAAIGS